MQIASGALEREAPFFMIKYYKWQNLSKERVYKKLR
jgi:hypothetical protein